jgi:hypothetical protein
MMLRFHGGAHLSGCYGKGVHMQSVGEKRNEHRRLLLQLVPYGTKDMSFILL